MELATNVFTAFVTNVVDADTIDCQIEVGLRNISLKERLRFARINAPERYTQEGRLAKEKVTEMLLGQEIKIIVMGVGKYGRLVTEIYLGDTNMSDWLVENGLAVLHNY